MKPCSRNNVVCYLLNRTPQEDLSSLVLFVNFSKGVFMV